MIHIYGSPRSSGGRCFLMLEEIGLPYQEMPLDMMGKKEHKSENFLRLNPNGKVPVLVDGDFVIWESMAINWYLADKYKPELLGDTPEERGLVHQWTTWAIVEVQPPMVEILIQTLFTPEEKRNPQIIEQAREKIPGRLQILDQALQNKKYLVGDRFTLADLNMASIVNLAAALQAPVKDYPSLNQWFQFMKERPSFKKFSEMRENKGSSKH